MHAMAAAAPQVEPDCSLVNGHRAPVNSIAFSPFRPSFMATGKTFDTPFVVAGPGPGMIVERRHPSVTLQPCCCFVLNVPFGRYSQP